MCFRQSGIDAAVIAQDNRKNKHSKGACESGGWVGGRRSRQRIPRPIKSEKEKKRKEEEEGKGSTLYADATEEAVAASAGSGGAPAEAPAGVLLRRGRLLAGPAGAPDVLRDDVEARLRLDGILWSHVFKFDGGRGSKRGRICARLSGWQANATLSLRINCFVLAG